MDTAEIIRELCNKKRMTLARLERELNFGNGTIAKASTTIRADRLKAIADYFGVTMEYLMTGEEDKGVAKRDTLLTDQEQELLRIFVLLDQGDRGKLSAYLDGLLAAEKYDKKELFA